MVCDPDHACTSCNAGQTCTSTDPCHTAAIVCSSGAPVCTDNGNAPNGTNCGSGKVCGNGVCDVVLAVSSTNPVDAATGVARNASISVTFNKPAQPLTTNTADGACSGSLQVSRAADNFATCVQMSAAPSPSGATSPTFIVTPVAPLVGSNKYFIRVTTSAVDAAGVAMANTYTSASGFTTSLALVVQSYSPSGPNVPRNSAVAVSFNRPADPTSLTAITSGTLMRRSWRLRR